MDTFQPTLPLRGATGTNQFRDERAPCFNPRSPCGERRDLPAHGFPRRYVSTHAPLAGSDNYNAQIEAYRQVSTHAPLAGSDRGLPDTCDTRYLVSTHAPLAGSD